MAEQQRLRLFIIQKGFGAGTTADPKYKCLEKYFNLAMPNVPEPTLEEEFLQGMEILKTEISIFNPHVMIACSRGGKYMATLISSKIWRGPTLLISALATRECIQCGIPIFVAHGIHDKTNVIERVREDISNGTPGLAKLVEFDDEHSLHTILLNDKIKDLVLEVYELKDKVKEFEAKAPKQPTVVPSRMRTNLFNELLVKAKR